MKRMPCQILVATNCKDDVVKLIKALNDVKFKLDSNFRYESLFKGKNSNPYPLCVSIIPSEKIFRPVNSIMMIALISDTEHTQPLLIDDILPNINRFFKRHEASYFWRVMNKVIKDKKHPKAELIIERN